MIGTATARTLFYFKPFNLTFKAGTYQYISNGPGAGLRVESTLITDGAIAYANSYNDTPFERTAQESFEITGSVLVIAEGQATDRTLYFFVQEKNIDISYVEHQEQNLPFTFEEGQFLADDDELQDNGIYKEWGKIILDGTQNWSGVLEATNMPDYYYAYTSEYDNLADGSYEGYSNKLANNHSYLLVTSVVTQECYSFNNTTNGLRIFIRKERLSEGTNTALKQYLANNPIEIQYKRIQAEIIPYNSTQQSQYNAIKQARSYDDQINISSTSNGLGFDMSVEALEQPVKQVLGGNY